MREILIQHSYITDCRFCDEICFYNTELNVALFQKKIKKEEEKESYQLVLFMKLNKTNIYMYTAPIECNEFLCPYACSIQFF